MKVSVLQENLVHGLKIANRAAATHSTLPILSHVMLAAEGEHLELSATDLEIGIITKIGAKVEEPGSITVPTRLLIDFVSTLPPERIDMMLGAKAQKLNLQCARFKANISGLDAKEFPMIPAITDKDTSFEIVPGDLERNTRCTIIAASTDVSRQILTGIFVELRNNIMAMAAADGFRLSTRRTNLEIDTGMSLDAIIPARAMSELLRLEIPGPIKIAIGENQVIFEVGTTRLVSQLIDGKFPDYTQIVPKSYETRTMLDRTTFLARVKAMNVFAREASNILLLKIGKGKVALSATSAEHGNSNTELEATIEGPELEIAFNTKYLIDVLSVLDADQVILETTTSAAPGVIRVVGDDGFTHVLMPMHVAK